MDAFLSALPSRRASFVAAAIFSGGIHLTLLFGFPGGVVITPAHSPEEPGSGCTIPISLYKEPPPPPVATTDKPTDSDNENQATSMVRATLAEPPPRFEPNTVTVPYKPEIGVAPNLENPLTTIPPGQVIAHPRGPGGDIVDLDDLDKRPEAVAQMAPAYPFEARNAHIEGVVMVRFIVTKDGTVESATIAATPHAAFNEPALAAVRKWKFRAGMKNGVKVATRMEIPLAFRITE